MAKGCAVAIVLDDVEQREIGDDEIARTIRKTSETRPKGGNHWSLRSVAKEIDHAPSSVHRIWRASGLQPHRVETFKLSTDPLFVEKVRDIVGLYLSPPARPASPASNAFAYPSGEAGEGRLAERGVWLRTVLMGHAKLPASTGMQTE